MKKPIHLRYNYQSANFNGVNEHAVAAMERLGIHYQHSTPQSMGDQWWFWNCTDIPENLPIYITELALDPIKAIGYGLSPDDAEKIKNYSYAIGKRD